MGGLCALPYASPPSTLTPLTGLCRASPRFCCCGFLTPGLDVVGDTAHHSTASPLTSPTVADLPVLCVSHSLASVVILAKPVHRI